MPSSHEKGVYVTQWFQLGSKLSRYVEENVFLVVCQFLNNLIKKGLGLGGWE